MKRNSCAIIPFVKSPENREVPSILFQDLLKINNGNRWNTIQMYASMRTTKFLSRFPDVVRDENGEVQIFEGKYFRNGETQIPLTNIKDEVNSLRSNIVSAMTRYLTSKISNITMDNVNLYIRLALSRIDRKIPIRKVITGAHELHSHYVKIDNEWDNPVQTLYHFLTNTADVATQLEVAKEYGMDTSKPFTEEERSRFKLQFALDYVVWANGNTGRKAVSEKVMKSLKPFVSVTSENSAVLKDFFELFDRGLFTGGIKTFDYQSQVADSLFRLVEDFTVNKETDTIQDAIDRYKEGVWIIRSSMRNYMYTPVKAQHGYFFYTRKEAESALLKDMQRHVENLERKLLTAYGTVNIDFTRATDSAKSLYQQYAKYKTIADNYDKLLEKLYPHKNRGNKKTDAYENMLDNELAEMELGEDAAVDVNINAETLGAENFNAERTQSPLTKDFLSTIRKPVYTPLKDGETAPEGATTVSINGKIHIKGKGELIKPRYAYLLAAKLLKGLEYDGNNEFYTEMEKRVPELGGTHSAAHYIVRAIRDLEVKTFDNALYLSNERRKIKREQTGRFENENFYTAPNGKTVTRKQGESSPNFYARIQAETGISNDQLMLAAQTFVNGDLFVTLVSHFSSLKEADYHYFETKSEDFLHDSQYRRGKSEGITSAVVNTILEKMSEVAEQNDGTTSKLVSLMKKALEEKPTEDQKKTLKAAGTDVNSYSHYLAAYRFLYDLGLTQLANELKIKNPNYITIAGHFKHMQKRLEDAVKAHNTAVEKYEKHQENLKKFTEEERKAAIPRALQVLENVKREKKEKYEAALEQKVNDALGTALQPVQAVKEEKELTPEELEKQKARAEREALKYDDLTDVEKLVYTSFVDYRTVPELNVRRIVRSIANDYSDALMKDNDNQKPVSIFSKDRKKKFTMHNSSNAWVLIQKIISVGDRVNLLKGMVAHFTSNYYQKNLFLSGKNRIFAWEDFDFSRNIAFNGNTNEMSYKDERYAGWIDRVLNGQFFDRLSFDKTEGVPVYSQVFPTISNRPTSFAVKVKALSETELVDAIEQTIIQMKHRQPRTDTFFDINSTVLFEVLAPYMNNGTLKGVDAKEVAKKIYDVEMEKLARELAEGIVANALPLHQNMLSPAFLSLLNEDTKDNVSRLINRKGGHTQATSYNKIQQRYESVFTVEDLIPALKVFVANNYVNSYHLVQLSMGDPAFFQNAEEMVKRSSGAFAPGVRGTVQKKNLGFGMRPNFRVLVGTDLIAGEMTNREFLTRMGLEGKDLEDRLSLFPQKKGTFKYDTADGFGVMLPRRRRDLTRGFGTSYGVTHISKPAYYGFTPDGKPVMLKYSSLELTDELCAKYPKLAMLRQNLEEMGMDEMIFASGVKTGVPSKTMDIEQLMSRPVMVDEGGYQWIDTGEVFEFSDSMMELQNKDYRLQHNPYHDLEGTTANPTQLSYFLNVLKENTELADRVYKSMAAVFTRRMKGFMDGGFEGMQKAFKKSLRGVGNERILEYVNAGISFEFPGIEKEAFTKIASMFKKSVIQIRFQRSQKLVAQADVGVTKQIWRDGQWVTTNEKLKTYLINPGKANERKVSECIIPRGALPPEVERMVEQRLRNGEEVFTTTGGDALAFRIPSSELHSAISVRVAGFFETQELDGVTVDSNMIIVPTDLMPIIGHDYDIDSFFVLERQSAENADGKTHFPGYTLKDGQYHFDENTNTDDFSDEEFEAFHLNNIIESFLVAIERPGPTRNRTNSPISFQSMEDDITEIEKLTKPGKRKLDLSNVNDNYKAFLSSFSGMQGVGIVANAMKSLAYSIRANKDGSVPTFNYKDKEPRIFIAGENGNTLLDKIEEKAEDLVNLWMSFDALLNSAVDNVKVQILPRLNIGDNTFKAYIAARAMGIDMETANRFMVQPVLTGLASFQKKFEVTKKLDQLQQAAGITEVEEAEEIVLDRKELEKWLEYAGDNGINNIDKIIASGNSEFIAFQAKLARAYNQFDQFGQAISDLSRYLSIVKELPVTIKDMKKFMDTRSKIINDDGTMNDKFRLSIPEFFHTNPHLKELDNVLLQFWQTIQSNFEIHSHGMEKMVDEVMQDFTLSGTSEEKYSKIKEEFQRYILSIIEEVDRYKWDNFDYSSVPATTNPKSNRQVNGRDAFAVHLTRMINALKVKLPTNKFLSLLSSTVTRNGAFIQMHGAHTMEYEDYIEMRLHFNELNKWDYDFTTGTLVPFTKPGFSPLQKHFVRYAMAEYGLKFGTKNFSLVFPPEIFLNVDRKYVEAISDRSFRDKYREDFAVQYALSNPDDVKPYKAEKGDIEWAGYNPALGIHYDLKTSNPDSPVIMRNDSFFNEEVTTKFYLKLANDEELGSYYAEIGTQPRKWYFQAPGKETLSERFRGDIRNYKVTDINSVPYLPVRPEVKPGDTVSVTAYSDPLRREKKYYEVTKIEDNRVYVQPTEEIKGKNPLDSYEIKRVELGNDKRKSAYQRYIRLLDSLSKRFGIEYDIVDSAEMLKRAGSEHLKGAFRNGRILLNRDTITSDTAFHEFIHPFIHAVKKENPDLYAALSREVQTTAEGKAVLQQVERNYRDLKENGPDKVELVEEAIVTLAANYAAKAHELTAPGLVRVLERLWNAITSYVNRLIQSGERVIPATLQTMSIQEIGTLVATGSNEFDLRIADMPNADSRIDQIAEDGKKITVETAIGGKEEAHYKDEKGNAFDRLTTFANNWLDRTIKERDITHAEFRANKLWEKLGVDKDVKIDTDLNDMGPLTHAEYVAKLTEMYEKGRVKGKLIHKLIELAVTPNEEARIRQEMAEINSEGLVKSFETRWVTDIADKLLQKFGINVRPETPEEQRDKVKSEVTVAIPELKLAGTMDMLIEHPDGTFSILEWKSGKSFIDRKFVNLLKKGAQRIDIMDNPMERAKLQVALYAVMLKMKYPDIRFRDLQVGWVNSERTALSRHNNSHVEVDSYIPMIRDLLTDADALKEMGIDPKTIAKLDPNGKLFNISEYSVYHAQNVEDMLKKGKTIEEIYDIKLNRIRAYQAQMDISNKGLGALTPEEKAEYKQLTQEVAELSKDPNMDLANSLDKNNDIGLWTRVFGNAADINNPMIRVWNTFRNERSLKAQAAYRQKIEKFNHLLMPVMQELKSAQGFIHSQSLGIMTGNYKQMWGWAYTYDKGQGNTKIRRFKTRNDADFKDLTKAQQELLNYINDTFYEYFGPEGFLNDVVLQVEGKGGRVENLTHLDIINKYTNDKDNPTLKYGFMPKVAVTREEMMYKYGNGSLIAGAFSKRYIHDLWRRSTSFYEENNYERWDVHQQALPVKYLGSPEIEATEDYTESVELIFSRFVQHMEHKKNMDHVYAFGKGIYNMMTDLPEDDRLSLTAAAFSDLLVKDVQGKMKLTKLPSKMKRTLGKGFTREISFDKVLMFLNSWSSSVVMQFRPFTATGNTIHGIILQGRRATTDSLVARLTKDASGTDYSLSDLWKAEIEYGKLLADAAGGNIRNNKLYMLSKMMNFHPNSSMFANTKEFISLRNKVLDPSMQFIMHTVGEEYLSYILLAAQMSAVKLSNGGSMLDAYQVEEDSTGLKKLVWTGGVRGYEVKGTGNMQRKIAIEGVTAKEVAKFKRVYENQQGSYRREELAAIEVYALGKALTSLKRYMHRILMVGFHSTMDDGALGRYLATGEAIDGVPVYEWEARRVEGRYRVLMKSFLYLASMGNIYTDYKFSKLTAEGKKTVVDATLTAAFAAAALGVYATAFDDKDEDDTFKKFWKRYFVDNPTQHYNLIDIVRNPGQVVPVALTRISHTATSFAQMMTALGLYAVTGDRDKLITQRGDLRGWNSFKKSIPYVAPATDFIDKMNNQDMFSWFEDDDSYRR